MQPDETVTIGGPVEVVREAQQHSLVYGCAVEIGRHFRYRRLPSWGESYWRCTSPACPAKADIDYMPRRP